MIEVNMRGVIYVKSDNLVTNVISVIVVIQKPGERGEL
jgi:hypothetical protein